MTTISLSFRADNQELVASQRPVLASDTVGYVEATFTLGTNWSGFDSVSALWKSGKTTIATTLDANGHCVVPSEVLKSPDEVKVNLVGFTIENGSLVERLTTFQITALSVGQKVKISGANDTVTPSQYERFVAEVTADADRASAAATSAAEDASDAEAYAIGKRSGTDVGSDDPAYHNNAKYYSEQAASSASSASSSASDASDAKDDAVAAKTAAVSAKNDAVDAKDIAVQKASDASDSAGSAASSATTAGNKALDSEAWATGKRNGTDVTSGDDTYQNNSKYYSGQASASAGTASTKASEASGSASDALSSARDAEAYAVGKRNGTDVASGDVAYHNNAYYYKDLAAGSASSASASASAADSSAEDAEAYAVGKRDGTDVTSGDAAYHNNSKYYAGQAESSATSASGSASAASGSAEDSEAYARGTRGGTAVTSGDATYHNNSKYYSEQASDSATSASGSAGTASQKAIDAAGYANTASQKATAASGSASAAEGSALDSQAWAEGKRGDTDVPSTDPAYNNNAKYWAEQAEQSAFGQVDTQMSDSSTNPVRNNVIKAYVDNADNGKVDKVNGKGLSTEDYTTAEKTKLAGIATGAQVNVQSDWNQSDSSADDYIKNKPANVSAFANDAGYLTSHQDISGKADKVSGATSGNFAGLDSNGNLTDSGNKASDFQVSGLLFVDGSGYISIDYDKL